MNKHFITFILALLIVFIPINNNDPNQINHNIVNLSSIPNVSGNAINLPSAPNNLHYKTESDRIIISWNPPSANGSSAITRYNIYRGSNSGQETFLYSEGSNVLSFTDFNVTNRHQYYYEVSAVNSIGIGPFSNEISVILNNTTTNNNITNNLPDAPQNLNYTMKYDRIIISWDPPSFNGSSSITNYIIYRGYTSGNETFQNAVGNVLIYNDSKVINGREYYYKIAAVNSAGIGPFSNEICALLNNSLIKGVPSAPQDLRVIVKGNQIILVWDPPFSNGSFPIIGYKIYYGNSSGNETYLSTLNSTQLHYCYNFTKLNGSEESFYYEVSAMNYLGESPLSNEYYVTFQTDPINNLINFPNSKSIGGINLGELICMGLIGVIAVVGLYYKKIKIF